MAWDWLPEYLPKFVDGLWATLQLFFLSVFFGFLMAIPIGLVQVTGPKWLGLIARGYRTLFRGTPLLIQLWLLYYGLGSVFPYYPGLRDSFIWPILVEAFPYAVVAFSLSVAAYEGHVMKGAFQSVPRGELEAGRAFGMSRFTLLRRVSLLFVGFIYICLAGLIIVLFRWLENRVPSESQL